MLKCVCALTVLLAVPLFAKTASCAEATREIYLAGGCFWGVEEYFSRMPGVTDAVSGYANGTTERPTYKEVCTGMTGHAETVRVTYDPSRVSLKAIVEHYFKIIDPTMRDRQGNDVGTQYRTGMYYTGQADRAVLEEVMEAERAKYARPLAVEIAPLASFYEAEDEHQDYLKKNPSGYCHITFDSLNNMLPERTTSSLDGSRYERRTIAELKEMLTPEEFSVTQYADTERPFTGKYWDHAEPGIYVDPTTGEPLFSSRDKYDSGCGWPSFTKPIAPQVVHAQLDGSHGMVRMEVVSRVGLAHLGHVFNDGPPDRGGLRYCINSASLRFVPYDRMDEEGYGDLKELVK